MLRRCLEPAPSPRGQWVDTATDQRRGLEYVYSQDIAGAKHFGVWPLDEAAQACFGLQTWPKTHPVPQATIEFEVDDVAGAARELEERGYRLVHPPRTEPWNQTIARLQTPDGVLVGICFHALAAQRVSQTPITASP